MRGMQTLEELRALERQDPAGFLGHIRSMTRAFVLGIEDHRSERGLTWGGELRLVVNRNITIHLVSDFNAEMERPPELPQFTVFADDAQQGRDHLTEIPLEGETEPVRGVIFYLSEADWRSVRAEAATLADRYAGFDLIPDTWLEGGKLLPLLEDRILAHPRIEQERAYDFRRGILHGTLPVEPPEEEAPEPDAADAFLARHENRDE